MSIICADDGTPYVVGARAVVEILFLIGERALTEEEFKFYVEVQTKINAALEKVEAMSDEEILLK